MGALFIDMAYLKMSDYENSCIGYRRKKNGRLYNIKVTEQLRELLAPHIKDKSKDNSFFYGNRIKIFSKK